MASSKTQKTRRDNAVQGTNDSSIVSKWSTANCEYYEDSFLQHFVSKKSRRSPLINRGYYIRAKSVDYAYSAFIEQHKEKPFQIVSLGAGFDSAYFRLQENGQLKNGVYVEIDFPDVVKRKATIIQNNRALSDFLHAVSKDHVGDEVALKASNYLLLGLDLTEVNLLTDCMRKHGIDPCVPTLLLSEVVLTYMSCESSNKVISWSSDYFNNAVFLTYEQVYPKDGFGQVMMKHFKKLGSPLRCIDTYQSIKDQVNRYISLGWNSASAIDMNHFYNYYLDETEKKRIESLEPFDEFEEWHLKCMHYILLSAFHKGQNNLKDKLWWCSDSSSVLGRNTFYSPTSYDSARVCYENESLNSFVTNGVIPLENSMPDSLEWTKRYGHSAVKLNSNFVVITGGFGEYKKLHTRLKDITIVDLQTNNVSTISISACNKLNNGEKYSSVIQSSADINSTKFISPVERLYHTCTLLSGNRILVYGGRRSPLNTSNDICLIHVKDDTFGDKDKQDIVNDISNVAKTPSESTAVGDVDQPKVCTPECLWQIIETHGEKPCPRWRHTASLLQLEGEDYVVIYGGLSVDSTVLDDCFILNTNTFMWNKITYQGQPLIRVHSHSATVYDNTIIVSGGLNKKGQQSNSIHQVQIQKCGNSFIGQVKEISPSIGIQPRYSHTSGVVNNCLVLVGGVSTQFPTPGLTVINLTSGKAKNIEIGMSHLDQPVLLHNHQMEMQSEMELIIIGGGGNCFSFGTHLNSGTFTIKLQQHHLQF